MAKKKIIPAIDVDDRGPGGGGGGRKNKIIEETVKEVKKILESTSKEQIDESMSPVDVANVVEKDIQKKQETLPESECMNLKLDLLHHLLTSDEIPEYLPDGLLMYAKQFEKFKKTVEDITDPFDPKYIEALRIFRDELIKI